MDKLKIEQLPVELVRHIMFQISDYETYLKACQLNSLFWTCLNKKDKRKRKEVLKPRYRATKKGCRYGRVSSEERKSILYDILASIIQSPTSRDEFPKRYIGNRKELIIENIDSLLRLAREQKLVEIC